MRLAKRKSNASEPMGRRRLALLAALFGLIALAGCSKTNPSYCCTELDNCTDPSAGIVGCKSEARPICNNEISACVPDPRSTSCAGPEACTFADLPVCLDGICVGCETNAQCGTSAPVCAAQNLCDRCIADAECAERSETPYCAPNGACAPCRTNDECTDPLADFCDEPTGTCRGCQNHGECSSGVCDKEAGTCVGAKDIFYVALTGGTGTCTKAMPCVSIAVAVSQITAAKKWIHLAAGDYNEAVTIDGATVNIVGPGARLSAGTGDVITIRPASKVLLDELEVRNARGTDADNIYCNEADLLILDTRSVNADDDALESVSCVATIKRSQFTTSAIGGHFIARTATIEDSTFSQNSVGLRADQTKNVCRRCVISGSLGKGAVAANSGELILEESTITKTLGLGVESVGGAKLELYRSEISKNSDGGILISSGAFFVDNSFIVDNGSANSTTGGFRMTVEALSTSRFSFNTVTGNKNSPAQMQHAGVHCGAPPGGLAISNSIVIGNTPEDNPSGCVPNFSIVPKFADFGDNIATPPTFVDAAAGDYHLAPGSAGVDAADPEATEGLDFDGEVRPQGPRRDMGADEVTVSQ